MTIDHTGISVSGEKHPEVVKWYEAALAPLGYKNAMSFADGKVIGFGDKEHSIDWWVSGFAKVESTSHHAFAAKGSYEYSNLQLHDSD